MKECKRPLVRRIPGVRLSSSGVGGGGIVACVQGPWFYQPGCVSPRSKVRFPTAFRLSINQTATCPTYLTVTRTRLAGCIASRECLSTASTVLQAYVSVEVKVRLRDMCILRRDSTQSLREQNLESTAPQSRCKQQPGTDHPTVFYWDVQVSQAAERPPLG